MALNTINRVPLDESQRRAILDNQAEKNKAAKKAEYLEQNPLKIGKVISDHSESIKAFDPGKMRLSRIKKGKKPKKQASRI